MVLWRASVADLNLVWLIAPTVVVDSFFDFTIIDEIAEMSRETKRQTLKKWSHSRPRGKSSMRDHDHRIKQYEPPRRKNWSTENPLSSDS